MRIMKRIGITLAVFLLILLVIGLILPSHWRAEESMEFAARGEHILPLVDTPKRWIDWSPWTPERFPGMELAFEGPERGAGALWHWTGEKSGKGSLEITKSDPGEGIEFVLRFEDFSPSPGGMRFDPSPVGTRVVWWLEGDVGKNPFARYFSLLMAPMLRKNFAAGLEKLKALAEAAEVAAQKEAEERAAEAARAAEEAARAAADAEGEAAEEAAAH